MEKSYVFYASFDEALRELPDKSRLKVYDAVSDYALYGIVTELSGTERAIFTLIKSMIDRRKQRVENGKKGGRKKQVSPNDTSSEVKPYLNHTSSIPKPNKNQSYGKVDVCLSQRESFPNEKESTKEKDNTLERENERKKEIDKDILSISACAYEDENELKSHEDIMQEWELSSGLTETMKEFLRHCYINGHVVSNAKLEDILLRLCERYTDEQSKIDCITKAIRGGYMDIKA